MGLRKITSTLATLFVFSMGMSAQAESLRIATWNVKEGSVENLLLRREGLKAAGKKIRADVMIVQELNSFASAQYLANAMEMSDVDIAVSNFGSDAEIIFFGFETAVISKVPIVSIDEWQQRVYVKKKRIPDPNGPILISRDGTITPKKTDAKHVLKVPSDIISDPKAREAGVSRGVMRVELDNGLVIYPVHLKSNLASLCGLVGRDLSDALRSLEKVGAAVPSVASQSASAIETIKNFTRAKKNKNAITRRVIQEKLPEFAASYARTAQNRENAAAFIAKKVKADLDAGLTVIVAGDFNTPINEPSKTGTDLESDCVPTPWSCNTKKVVNSCSARDGFDDTLHILSGGVVDGVELLPLFRKDEPTHIKPGFANSPIDNILIGGPLASKASDAKKVVGSGDASFGSDHFPLVTVLTLD